MRHIDGYIARLELFVNRIDYIPCVASFSGMSRILAGGAEVITGIAIAALNLLRNLLQIEMDVWETANSGLIYSLHGMGNIVRGAIAMLPGVNLILFVHDRYLGRMNYPEEFLKEGVYPLMDSSPLVEY